MSDILKEWANNHPVAAMELFNALTDPLELVDDRLKTGKREACSQQSARISIAMQGAFAFRNNVGATPIRCPKCGYKRQPVRYGLANDSHQMNTRVKSSDLILMIPRKITPDMVGSVIAQFGAVEVKHQGWEYTGTKREVAQGNFLALVEQNGGFARFSTGSIDLGLK